MEIIIDGMKVNYVDEGVGTPILMLHGWGCNCTHFNTLINCFKNNYRVISIDIPGFGGSDEPSLPWGTVEYANFIEKFMSAVDIDKPILVGHSNGGRISIMLGSRGLARAIILADSAGIKPKRGLDYYIKVYSYKAMKSVLNLPILRNRKEQILESRRKSAGSADYQNASPMMRQILSKVVNEDLRTELSRITVPTLLVWGDKDTATPLSDAKTMEEILKKAGSDVALIVFEGKGHYAFLEDNAKFLAVMDAFIKQFKEELN